MKKKVFSWFQLTALLIVAVILGLQVLFAIDLDNMPANLCPLCQTMWINANNAKTQVQITQQLVLTLQIAEGNAKKSLDDNNKAITSKQGDMAILVTLAVGAWIAVAAAAAEPAGWFFLASLIAIAVASDAAVYKVQIEISDLQGENPALTTALDTAKANTAAGEATLTVKYQNLDKAQDDLQKCIDSVPP